MVKKLKRLIGVVAFLSFAENSYSFEFNKKNFYTGGGVTYNTFESGNAFGSQWFAGYDISEYFLLVPRVGLAAEAGYSNIVKSASTIRRYEGVWSDMSLNYKYNSRIKYINRLGVDFGNANGVMMGLGLEYAIDRNIKVRSELVMRGVYKSYQVNALYRF